MRKTIVTIVILILVMTIIISGCGNNNPNNNPGNNQNNNTDNGNNGDDLKADSLIDVILYEDFENNPDLTLLTDSEDVALETILEDHYVYPAPRGENVFKTTGGTVYIKGDFGKVVENSIYTISFYVASASDSGFGNLSLYIQNKTTKKIYSAALSASDTSFKLNNILWNRVTLSINTNDMDVLPEDGEIVYEIKTNSVLIDDFMVTRRDASPMDMYVSNSESESKDLGTKENPFYSMNTVSATYLVPGDNVYIKSGDSFEDKIYLIGKGKEGNPITVTSYGEGERPQFAMGKNKLTDVIFTYENPSYVNISNLNLKEGKIGLYLRYFRDVGNKEVRVENCLFENFDDVYCEPNEFQNELGFSSGIWLSGVNPGGQSDVVDGLYIIDNYFEYCVSGFNTNWFYFDYKNHPKDVIKNVLIQGGHAKASSVAGSLLVQWADTVTVRDFRQFGRNPNADDTWFKWGTAGMMFGSSKNILIENCELSDVDRFADNEELKEELANNPDKMKELAGGFDPYFGLHMVFSGDACGIDIDGNNENVTFRNNVVHSNDGMGLEILTTISRNINVVIEDCTFYNNGTDVKNKWEVENYYWDGQDWIIEYDYDNYLFHGDAWEVKLDTSASGRLNNINMYRADNSFGWISTNRNLIREEEYGEYWYRDVKDLPTSKQFNLEGSVKSDTEIIFDNIFINTFRLPILEIEMSVIGSNEAKIYYITDLDRVYSDDKVYIAKKSENGKYTVDTMEDGFKGVLVGIKIIPSQNEGDEYSIGKVEFHD